MSVPSLCAIRLSMVQNLYESIVFDSIRANIASWIYDRFR